VQDLTEEVSGLPPPLASSLEEGLQMSREIIGRYLPNLSWLVLGIGLGEECTSLHTRWQAGNTALSIYGLTPELHCRSGNGQPPRD
jgi:hypothetical protein